jgi:hypothetical protein
VEPGFVDITNSGQGCLGIVVVCRVVQVGNITCTDEGNSQFSHLVSTSLLTSFHFAKRSPPWRKIRITNSPEVMRDGKNQLLVAVFHFLILPSADHNPSTGSSRNACLLWW